MGGTPSPTICCGATVLCGVCAARGVRVDADSHTHATLNKITRTDVRSRYTAMVCTEAIVPGDVLLTEHPLVMSHADNAAECMSNALAHAIQYTTLYCSDRMAYDDFLDVEKRLLKLKLSQMQCNMFAIGGKAVLFDAICRINHRCGKKCDCEHGSFMLLLQNGF